MSDDNHKWVDALVSGVIIGLMTVAVFLIRALVLLLLRCWDKYREHRLMHGIASAWAAVAGLALSVALLPGGAALAAWLGLSATILALGVLAVGELILDYRVNRAEAAEEDLTRHLGPW